MRRALPPLLAVVLLLSGCAGTGGGAPASSPATTSASADAADLVGGFWRVSDAAGESADTWITFGARSGTLYRPNGIIGFGWEAQGDAILASRDSWSMSLGTDSRARWLDRAATVAPDGAGWTLRDTDGAAVARLARGGSPAPSKDYTTEAETAAPGDAAFLAPAVPGDGATDVPASRISGVWRLAGVPGVSVTLRDGAWTARTTCASHTGSGGGAGGYRVLDGGLLLVTQGPTALTGCTVTQDLPPEGWRAVAAFGTARSFAVGDAGLTLYDRDGTALGTLVR